MPVEQDEDLSQPILKRIRMVRLMKTSQSIQELATQPRVRRMAHNLIDQLIEPMPELQGVGCQSARVAACRNWAEPSSDSC